VSVGFELAQADGFPNSRLRLSNATRKAVEDYSTPKPGGDRRNLAGAPANSASGIRGPASLRYLLPNYGDNSSINFLTIFT
jgi:hypothetical protein